MTVAELIERLSGMPQDRPVAVEDADGDATEVVDVRDYGPDDYVMVLGEASS